MQRNLLTTEQAKQAEGIAEKLNAPNLLVRLQQITPESLGNLKVLSPELMKIILDQALEGAKPRKILQLLTVSKGFNKELMKGVNSLDLSSYKDKVTDNVISTIVSIFPNLKN